jgi:hypothetical protein
VPQVVEGPQVRLDAGGRESGRSASRNVSARWTVPWQAGDTVIGHGNTRYRVVSVIPLERIAEFVDEPLNGVLTVEPT